MSALGLPFAIDRVPQRALDEYISRFVPEDAGSGSLELAIRVSQEALSARDLSAYLLFADKVFGSFLPGGFSSYSQRDKERLRLDVRAGSLKLVARESGQGPRAHALVLLYLVLQHVASLEELDLGSISHRDLGQEPERAGRGVKEQVRNSIRATAELGELTSSRQVQLSTFLSHIYHRYASEIPRVVRFAASAVYEVTLLRVEEAEGSDRPFPLRGLPVSYSAPFLPVAESDWEAAS